MSERENDLTEAVLEALLRKAKAEAGDKKLTFTPTTVTYRLGYEITREEITGSKSQTRTMDWSKVDWGD